MPSVKSHLTILEDSAVRFENWAAFRVPVLNSSSNAVERWDSITYSTFHKDVEAVARHWLMTLSRAGIPARSVVGLWLAGMTYTDVLHVYGLARAGFIPQVFSLRLPNPDIIFELMQIAGAKALIHDFSGDLTHSTVPAYRAGPRAAVDPSSATLRLPSLTDGLKPEDIFCVFHTSGSTSGSPKLIPCSYEWLGNIISKSYNVCKPLSSNGQDVTTWVGSMSHIAQTFMFLGGLQHGACVIQPTQIIFSTPELLDMIERCSLNRLRQFGTFLSKHIAIARRDPKVHAALLSLDEVFFCGIGLPQEDEEFAYRTGIKLRNLFGSTEVGAMLVTIDGKPFFQPLEGTRYAFWPIDGEDHKEQGRRNANNSRLLELVILGESGDCPHRSLRSADGHYHTGDLFQEVLPGNYVFRGRNDDWIKSENSLRCDTKAIEENVRTLCADLVEDCIVVGTGRPSPALFVEAAVTWDHDKLKKEILRRTRHFHSRRYLHERITTTQCIVIVPRKTLPRTATKGNIRRKAVEESFKTELDQIYAVRA